MKIKKFHLKDFPSERIRVLFKNNTRFLDENINYFGSLQKLADFLSISPQVISGWRKFNLFIPLEYIRKIVDKRKLNWSEIEGNVIAYKGPNSSLIVQNPKLPIVESPELFAIISHLIGDGSVNKNNIPIYTNSNKNLIENFKRLIKYVFGDAEGRVYKSQSGAYQFRTSRVIADLIKSFYNINFDSLTAKFPVSVFRLPEEYSCAVIRAIVDDEGMVGDNRIPIKMNNKHLMMQIRKMLIKILGKRAITRLRCYKDGSCEVCIKSSHLKTFERKIKLIHPRKRNNLSYAIKKAEYRDIKHRGDRWETKSIILKLLSTESLTISDLAKRLFIDKNNIISHVKDLEGKSLIEKVKYMRSFKCSITKEGKNFLKENLPSSKKIKINLTQIDYNSLNNRNNRILLNEEVRNKLFWLLEIIYKNQSNIAKLFNVHRNTISYWKNGNTLIPSSILNKMLIFLGDRGVNLTDDINTNIKDVRTINGRYKIHGGDLYDVHLCRPTFT